VAREIGQRYLRRAVGGESLHQLGAAQARSAALVALVVPQEQGQETAVQYIGSFEDAVAQAARKRGVDTVVCGHIHRAEMRDINGILYCNDGDWVESCTSLVEDMNGQLRLIDWPQTARADPMVPVALPVGQAA